MRRWRRGILQRPRAAKGGDVVSVFSNGLLMPAMVLALLAWLVPKLLSMMLGEGVKPLFVNTILSVIVLFVISSGYFIALYLSQGVPLSKLMQPGWASNIAFYGRLGLSAAIIWAPIMVLSLAALPRTWVHETW